jgi:NTE family protein
MRASFTLGCILLVLGAASSPGAGARPGDANHPHVGARDLPGDASRPRGDASRPRISASSVPADASRPRIGLALSGGGARGLAHIGVLKVIEEAGVPVDVVSGTSMGSIIGALYAMGYTPEAIERIALTTDWDDLLSDRLARNQLAMKNRKRDDRYLVSFPVMEGQVKLPAGLSRGQEIYNLFARLSWPALEITDFRKLPRPFSCVATDIVSGEVVVLDRGSLPDALRASMAIPSVFTPARLGHRLLVDGGLKRNLPAEDAINLGADIVIGVDVGEALLPAEKLVTLVDILGQTIDLAREPDHQKQMRLCDILIVPETQDYSTLDFARAREFIRLGEQAARAHMSELRALADSLGAKRLPGVDSVSCNPVLIDAIEISGLRDVSSRFVAAELGIAPHTSVNAEELERAIERLYSSGFFTDLSYRFEQTPTGRKLVVVVRENSSIFLNTGLRYDTQRGASLLLNASFRNLVEHGSQIEVDLLLGDRKRFTAEYALHTGIRRSVGLRVDADYIDDHIDVYEGEERASRWRTLTTRGGLLFETLLSRVFYGAAGLNIEWYRTSPDIAPPELSRESRRLAYISGDLWFDTLDRSWFPRKGLVFKARAEAAGSALGGETSFNRTYLTWQLVIPLHRSVSVTGSVFAGFTEGGRAPLHYAFFVGGINPYTVFQGDRVFSCYGYRNQELSGRNALAAGVDAQIEVINKWYIGLHGNAGSASDVRKDLLKTDSIRSGGAVSLGVETPVGPAELFLTYSGRNNVGTYLSIGFLF